MVLDAQGAAALLNSVQQIDHAIRRIDVSIQEVLRHVGYDLSKVEGQVGKVGTAAKRVTKEITEDGKVLLKSQLDGLDNMSIGWTNVGRKAHQVLERIERHPAMKVLAGNPDKAGVITGQFGGIERGFDRMRSKIFSSLSVGGILGVLLFGRSEDARFKSDAAVVLSTLQQTGTGAEKFIGGLATRAEELHTAYKLSINEVFSTGFHALTEHGLGVAQALQQVQLRADGTKGSMTELMFWLDKFNDAPAGTTANAAASIVADSGMQFDEAVKVMAKLNTLTRDTGVNYRLLAGAISQASSALRLQTQDASGLAVAYLSMRKGLAGALPGQGAGHDAFLSKTAMGAVGGLSQRIAGFSDPVMAFLGQDIAKKQGLGDIGGIEALYQFQTGFRNQKTQPGFNPLIATVNSMLETVRGMGGSTAERSFALQRGPFGLGRDEALALADSGNLSAEQFVAANPEFVKKVETALGQQDAKTDTVEQLLSKIEGLLRAIGTGLINILAQTFSLLRSGFNALSAYLDGDFAGGSAILKVASKNFSVQGDLDRIAKAGIEVYKEAGQTVDTTNQAPDSVGLDSPAVQRELGNRGRLPGPRGAGFRPLISVPMGPLLPATIDSGRAVFNAAEYVFELIVKPKNTGTATTGSDQAGQF